MVHDVIPGPLWMRHGTCDDGLRRPGAHARPDSPLTPIGAVEVEDTTRELRKRRPPPTLVVSSPLRRARQTATIVAGALGAPLSPAVAAFAEWQAPECVLGRTVAEYPRDYLQWRDQRRRDPHSALAGGESLSAFARRATVAGTVAGSLTAVGGLVLIVSHRLLIGAIAALHLGYRDPADIFDFATAFSLAPARLWAPTTQEY
jgi:broad specificity phosphatase PhoE